MTGTPSGEPWPRPCEDDLTDLTPISRAAWPRWRPGTVPSAIRRLVSNARPRPGPPPGRGECERLVWAHPVPGGFVTVEQHLGAAPVPPRYVIAEWDPGGFARRSVVVHVPRGQVDAWATRWTAIVTAETAWPCSRAPAGAPGPPEPEPSVGPA